MFVITRMYTIDISVINPLFSGPIEFLWQLATRFSCIVFTFFSSFSFSALSARFLLSPCWHYIGNFYRLFWILVYTQRPWLLFPNIRDLAVQKWDIEKKEKTTSSFYLPSSHPGHHFTAHHTHFLYFIEFLWEIACIMCLFTTPFYYSWESQYQKKKGFLWTAVKRKRLLQLQFEHKKLIESLSSVIILCEMQKCHIWIWLNCASFFRGGMILPLGSRELVGASWFYAH